MRRKQQRIFVSAMIKYAPACCTRLLWQFAEYGVPLGRIDLQRMVHNITAKQRPLASVRELKNHVTNGVAGRRFNQ